jgi:hypothetical protein
MKCFGLACLLFGCASWGQAVNSGSALATQGANQPIAAANETAGTGRPVSAASKVALDQPLITIAGLCDDPRDKVAAPGCKTVITRSQFQDVVNALEPGMRAHERRDFALHYAEVLVMAGKAEQMGLDRGEMFEEQMKLARIQTLSQALRKMVREKVSQIPESEVEDFYHNNTARFEKAELDRIYIPRTRQAQADCDSNLNDEESQKCSQASEQTMKKEADMLRARAMAGEEFSVLQAHAYRVAGIKSAAPGTSISVRRISLPPGQVSVMNLMPGEVSPVLADPNGYFVYKVKAKAMVPLDQASNEIKEALRTQRMQDEMSGILNSTPATVDESYFAR